jgi:hypothetical protein
MMQPRPATTAAEETQPAEPPRAALDPFDDAADAEAGTDAAAEGGADAATEGGAEAAAEGAAEAAEVASVSSLASSTDAASSAASSDAASLLSLGNRRRGLSEVGSP